MPSAEDMERWESEGGFAERDLAEEAARDERIRRERDVQALVRAIEEAREETPGALTGGLRMDTCPHCGGVL